MKKYIIHIVIIILFIVAFILLLLNNKKKIIPKIITVNSVNSFLYNEEQMIELSLFINDVDFPMGDINTFKSFKVSNHDDSKSLKLDLKEITYSHNELLFNDNYYKYYLKFIFPNLENNFYIEEAYLSISLLNNEKFTFKIGEFNLIYVNDSTDMKWNYLEGIIDENIQYNLNSIRLDIELDKEEIKRIYTKPNEELEYKSNENMIIIYLNDKFKVNSYIPLIIETTTNTYVFNNFHYITEYDLLEKSRNILNIYEFNTTNWCKKVLFK